MQTLLLTMFLKYVIIYIKKVRKEMIYQFLMEDFNGERYCEDYETKESALIAANIFRKFKSTSIIFIYEIGNNCYNKIYEYRRY